MYIFIVFLSIVCFVLGILRSQYKFSNRLNNATCLFIVLLLILVGGFRNGISGGYPDYLGYVYNYLYFDQHLEFTFSLICKIARFIDDGNYYILFLIYALLGVSLKFFAFNSLSNNVYLSLAMYLCFFYPLHDLIQIRAGVAAGILLLSVRDLYDRNYKRFSCAILFATCFHLSSLLFLILLFLDSKSFNKKIWVLVIAFSLVVSYLFNISLLNVGEVLQEGRIYEKIIYYQSAAENGNIEEVSMFSSFMLLNYFIMVLLFVYADRIVFINKYFYIFFKQFLIGIIFYILFVRNIPTLAVRGFELYSISLLILLPSFFYVFKNRMLSVFLLFFIGFCYLYVTYVRKLVPLF